MKEITIFEKELEIVGNNFFLAKEIPELEPNDIVVVHYDNGFIEQVKYRNPAIQIRIVRKIK